MMSTIPVAASQARRVASGLTLALCGLVAWVPPLARAQTALSDSPILASQPVPGNVALALSVEFPTAISVAYTNRTYSSANSYLGYFDADKCYTYSYTDGTSVNNYFVPAGGTLTTGSHTCTGQWSGNFLNWASMQTIDPFRWVLTGGYRVIDNTTTTVIEKAWGSVQGSAGGNFPDSSVSNGTDIARATPFPSTTPSFGMSIWGQGNQMLFAVPSAPTTTTKKGQTTTTPGVMPALTSSSATAYNGTATGLGVVYKVFIRVKVCDPALGTALLESNCVAYGSNYKPEGLLQQYSSKLRFSAFGYLNDGDILRDGGVLRAQQKFVGPTQPVPGSTPITNAPGATAGQTTGAEWSATTGVMTLNPDATDATNTAGIMGLTSSSVTNSGVLNYLNKFGSTAQSYKTYDNVSELYYAALRYFKNLPKVPEWTAVLSGTSQATIATWTDGFPVITAPPDPLLYSCQRNFILGIGDVHTHADKNVPHAGTTLAANEPGMPPLVAADTSVNAVTRTNQVGVMEGLGAISATIGTKNPWGSCCNNNSALIAGLAYDAHITDIRGRTLVDQPKPQTVDTYWVDVWEGGSYEANNQFYLATKYGGFTVPAGYTAGTALTPGSWHTNTDMNGTQPRPDNYFSGGQPAAMQAGLNAAFSKIAASLTAVTTSFSTSLPQVAQSGNASYSSQYDATNWTGELTASTLTFDATTDKPSLTQAWLFTDKLTAQLSAAGSYLTNRRIVSWDGGTVGVGKGVQFCSGTAACTVPLTATQLTALDPSYVTGNDSADYLKYLRGDKTNEKGASGTDAYRARVKPLGDIVGSKARPVGPPSFPYSDSANPGYSKFRTDNAGRPTVVYVGSNDGMMHAVQGDLTASPGGRELFAYVPNALFRTSAATSSVDGLASLGNPSFVHHFMVNATPNVYDVDFSRTAGSTPTALGDWRSILISGLGKGGKSYYAIDVTAPVDNSGNPWSEATMASKVLWEFSNSTPGMSGELGYTFGDPIVVKTPKWGWVVIITSGYNNADGKGYFFIINPKTGALLEKISTGVGTATAAGSAGLAFANAFVLDGTDGTIDAVYAGDLLGNLWRWDVSGTGTYPAPLRLATLTDGTNPQPVTSRPLIEVHPSLKKRFVLVGTGRLLDNTDINSTQVQSFYAIADGTNARFNAAADLPSPITFPITRSVLSLNTTPLDWTKTLGYDPATQMGWVEDLGAGWRVTTDPTSLLSSVAWAATLPSVTDVCTPSGTSHVYARDFGTASTTLINTDNTALAYVALGGNVIDMHYLSVNGKARLVVGTDTASPTDGTGGLYSPPEKPLTGSLLRRLNWRELQTVE